MMLSSAKHEVLTAGGPTGENVPADIREVGLYMEWRWEISLEGRTRFL